MNLVYLIAAAFVFLVTMDAHADRVDQLETTDVAQYCMTTVRFFHGGADGFVSGYARKVSQPSPEAIESIEHRIPLPRDSMWVVQWDQLNKREQDFMRTIIFQGWDEAKKLKDAGVEPDVSKMDQTYFEGCLQKRAAARSSFKQVASSERIAKPSEQTCEELRFDTHLIGEAMSDGVPQAQLSALAHRSKELSDERLERILRQITEAYAWEGKFQEWIDKEMKGCD